MSKWKTGKYVFNTIFPKPKPTKTESFKVFSKKLSGKFKKDFYLLHRLWILCPDRPGKYQDGERKYRQNDLVLVVVLPSF